MSWLSGAWNAVKGVGRSMGGWGGAAMSGMQMVGSSGNMMAQQGAQMWQERQQTMQNIMTMQAQTRADRMKQTAQRHQIRMETQNKIMEMARETAINRTKSASKIHNKLVQVMMS